MTASWREIAMSWHRQHAPLTSYDRLVRASVSELSPEERSQIRKDIKRSQPPFFSTLAPGDLDLTAHGERLERVLAAWTQYDQEIGYVQAMNLVASTLLLLLDGDEEASFWTLVTLLRQLPPQFYSRAPLQLLGFWTEVEVLSQLAGRLLGLVQLRNALLQVAPSWLLEFWVGTLPLELIVMIWDHMVRNALTTRPSVLNLQVALVLLQQLQPQLSEILSIHDATTASHAAFTLLKSIRVPDASSEWLLHRAQQLRLNESAVQDMRLQLRTALVELCGSTDGTLPCGLPLPEHYDFAKPLPIIDLSASRRRRPYRCARSLMCIEHPIATGTSLALLIHLGAFGTSVVIWAPELLGASGGHSSTTTGWDLTHVDLLAVQLAALLGVLIAYRCECARVAAALGSTLVVLWLGTRAATTIVSCTDHVATHAEPPLLPPPPPPHGKVVPPASDSLPDSLDCSDFGTLWLPILCGLIALAAAFQIFVAWCTRSVCARRDDEVRLNVMDGNTSISEAAVAVARRGSRSSGRGASRVSASDLTPGR
jgi:hypothetical protein